MRMRGHFNISKKVNAELHLSAVTSLLCVCVAQSGIISLKNDLNHFSSKYAKHYPEQAFQM